MRINRLTLFTLLIFSFLCTTLSAQTETCSDIIAKVEHYLNQDTSDHQTSQAHVDNWHEVSWIEKQMGAGTKNEVVNKTYFWSNFGLVTVNDNTVAKIGIIPSQLAKMSANELPTIEAAINTLGKPTKVNTKTFYRYTWLCADTNSNLIVNATISGKVLSVAGMHCKNDIADATNSSNCVGFSSLQKGQSEELY